MSLQWTWNKLQLETEKWVSVWAHWQGDVREEPQRIRDRITDSPPSNAEPALQGAWRMLQCGLITSPSNSSPSLSVQRKLWFGAVKSGSWNNERPVLAFPRHHIMEIQIFSEFFLQVRWHWLRFFLPSYLNQLLFPPCVRASESHILLCHNWQCLLCGFSCPSSACSWGRVKVISWKLDPKSWAWLQTNDPKANKPYQLSLDQF